MAGINDIFHNPNKPEKEIDKVFRLIEESKFNAISAEESLYNAGLEDAKRIIKEHLT